MEATVAVDVDDVLADDEYVEWDETLDEDVNVERRLIGGGAGGDALAMGQFAVMEIRA